MSRRDLWRRAVLVALLAAVLPVHGAHPTTASEQAAATAGVLNNAPPRPRLDAPPAPEPRGIRLPNARNLLFAKRELQVPPHVRLMVFAPHPDDETLGAGGLIQRVLAASASSGLGLIQPGKRFGEDARSRRWVRPPGFL